MNPNKPDADKAAEEIITSKGVFLFVPVPDGAMRFSFYGHTEIDSIHCLTMPIPGKFKKYEISLNPGKYTFLFTTDNVSESDAEKVVDSYVYVLPDTDETELWCKDYTDVQQIVGRDFTFDEAKLSFQSLLKANNITGNNACLKKEE